MCLATWAARLKASVIGWTARGVSPISATAWPIKLALATRALNAMKTLPPEQPEWARAAHPEAYRRGPCDVPASASIEGQVGLYGVGTGGRSEYDSERVWGLVTSHLQLWDAHVRCSTNSKGWPLTSALP
jgi:hypothetical protein